MDFKICFNDHRKEFKDHNIASVEKRLSLPGHSFNNNVNFGVIAMVTNPKQVTAEKKL